MPSIVPNEHDTVPTGPPLVGVVMGSDSDAAVMSAAVDVLKSFDVPFEVGVVSAHRTPHDMIRYGETAANRGLRVIVAAAGGAAHLPGMLAATTTLPVIGVPISLGRLDGLDSLLSIVQMPKGVPVASVAIDGARNGALLAIRILAAAPDDLGIRLTEGLEELSREMAETARQADAGLVDRLGRH